MPWTWLRGGQSLLIGIGISFLFRGGSAIALPATSNRTLSNDCTGLLPEVIPDPITKMYTGRCLRRLPSSNEQQVRNPGLRQGRGF
jgi:hypothetical protein